MGEGRGGGCVLLLSLPPFCWSVRSTPDGDETDVGSDEPVSSRCCAARVDGMRAKRNSWFYDRAMTHDKIGV